MSRLGSNLGVLASVAQRGRQVAVPRQTGGIISDSPASIVAGQLRDLLGAAISATETAINVQRLDLREARAARERESGQARELAHARLGADVERFLAEGAEPDLSRLDEHDRQVYRARFDAEVRNVREQEATAERVNRIQRRRQFIEAGLPADFEYAGDLDQIREMRLAAAGQAEVMVRQLDAAFLAQPKDASGRPSRMPSEFLEEVLRDAPVNDPVYLAELRSLTGRHVLDRDFAIQTALDRDQQRRNRSAAVESIEESWQREVFAADFDAPPPLRPAGEMLVESIERAHGRLTDLGLDPADVKLRLLGALASRAMATGDRRYLDAVKDWRFLNRTWWEEASQAFEQRRDRAADERRRTDKRYFDAAFDESLDGLQGAMGVLASYAGERGAAAAAEASRRLAESMPTPSALAGARLGNPVAAIIGLTDPVVLAAQHRARLDHQVERALADGLIDDVEARIRRGEIAERFAEIGREHQTFAAALARFDGRDAQAGVLIELTPEVDAALGRLWDAEIEQAQGAANLPGLYAGLARRARAIPGSHEKRLSALVESADPNAFRAGVEILDAIERVVPGLRLRLTPDATARVAALRALRPHADLADLAPRLMRLNAEGVQRADAARAATIADPAAKGDTRMVEQIAVALGVTDAASIDYVDPGTARLLDAAYRLRFAEVVESGNAIDDADAAAKAIVFAAHETAGRLDAIRLPDFSANAILWGAMRLRGGRGPIHYLVPRGRLAVRGGFPVRAFVQRPEFRPLVEHHIETQLPGQADLVDDVRYRFDLFDRDAALLPIEVKIGGSWMMLPERMPLPSDLETMRTMLDSEPVQRWRGREERARLSAFGVGSGMGP